MTYKIKSVALLSLIAFIALATTSCRDKHFEERTYMANVPIYMSNEDLSQSIQSEDAQAITDRGKIFLKDDFILINKPGKGIHVIDNADAANPVNFAFINIPGNVDIAATGNTLYADTYQDLLVIDFTDPLNISLLERFDNIYPGALPPLADPHYPMAMIDDDKGVVIGWTVEEVTEKVDENSQEPWVRRGGVMLEDAASTNFAGTSAPTNVSISGSMARMVINGNYLYTVGNGELTAFNITNKSNPTRGTGIPVAWNIETLFPFQEDLLIGTTTGMLVYDLINPMSPNYRSMFSHASSCDPVVAEGNTAYVTLRGGTECGGFSNQLDVIDISNMDNPQLIKSYEMEGPYGLGIDNGTLFICDGDAGLKVYDAANPLTIDQNQLSHQTSINTFDVIPYKGHLIMIGSDGLYQYDYTDLSNFTLLSVISTQ